MQRTFRVLLFVLVAGTGLCSCIVAARAWPSSPHQYADYIRATVLSCEDTVATRRAVIAKYSTETWGPSKVKALLAAPSVVMTLQVHQHPGLLAWTSRGKLYRFWTPGINSSEVLKVQMEMTPKACTSKLLYQEHYFSFSASTCDVLPPPDAVCMVPEPLATLVPDDLPKLDCSLQEMLADGTCNPRAMEPPPQGADWPAKASVIHYRVKVTACKDTLALRQAYVQKHPDAWYVTDFPSAQVSGDVTEQQDMIVWTSQRRRGLYYGARRAVHMTAQQFQVGDSPADCERYLLGRGLPCHVTFLNCQKDKSISGSLCAVHRPLLTCLDSRFGPQDAHPRRHRFPCTLRGILEAGECTPPSD